jgi:hypothetical protein
MEKICIALIFSLPTVVNAQGSSLPAGGRITIHSSSGSAIGELLSIGVAGYENVYVVPTKTNGKVVGLHVTPLYANQTSDQAGAPSFTPIGVESASVWTGPNCTGERYISRQLSLSEWVGLTPAFVSYGEFGQTRLMIAGSEKPTIILPQSFGDLHPHSCVEYQQSQGPVAAFRIASVLPWTHGDKLFAKWKATQRE